MNGGAKGPERPSEPPSSGSGREMASVGVGVCMFALSRGVSLEAILAATGLKADTLLNPGAWVPQAVLRGMWELLAAALPGRLVSLDMAEFAAPLLAGDIAKAVQFAPDVGTTIRLLSRNAPLLGDGICIDIVDGPIETDFRMHHPSDEVDGGYGAELGMGVAASVSVRQFGRRVISRVDFRHQPNSAHNTYTDFFGCEVRFGQPFNALVLATADLSTPTVSAEPSLAVFASQWLDRLRDDQGVKNASDAAHRIRAAILANAKRADYTTTGLAQTMGMSLRSLRRLLATEGLDAQSVLEGLRRAYATELLRDTRLSIEQIAEHLGYADERSFRRAYERWHGVSPAKARRGA